MSTIEHQTVLDRIEITRNGTVHLRLGLLLLEEGQEISCAWHRTVIEPGVDPSAQIAAVNEHLTAMRKAQLHSEAMPLIAKIVAATHTPQVVKAFETSRAAALAALEGAGAPAAKG